MPCTALGIYALTVYGINVDAIARQYHTLVSPESSGIAYETHSLEDRGKRPIGWLTIMARKQAAITIFLSLVLGVIAFALWSKTPWGHDIVFKQTSILRADIAKIAVVPNTFTNLRIYLFAYSFKQTVFWIKLLSPFIVSVGLLLLAASALFSPEQ